MRGPNFSDLPKRFLSALVMITLALSSLFQGGWVFVLFWLVCGLIVNWEWQRIIDAQRLAWRVGAGGFALVLAAFLVVRHAADVAVFLSAVGAIAAASLAVPGRRVWAFCGVLYAAALVISVCLLRQSVLHGVEAIIWLFAVVWGTDVMAYMGGRIIGGPKLWPQVSPSKTWAGFLVGITSGALLGLVVLSVAFSESIPLASLFVLGLLTAALSQGGDLLESSIKRHFQVKDSSQLIPGHGGFMDRLDGFVTAVTFAAIIGAASAGAAAAAHGLFIW